MAAGKVIVFVGGGGIKNHEGKKLNGEGGIF